jgi:ribosome biogenesis GTPase
MKIARVTEAHRTNFIVIREGVEYIATVRGNFHQKQQDFPKVGDFVNVQIMPDNKAVIEEVINRRSVIKRKSADGDEEQIIAANVDLIFVVMGLDGDYNLNRLQRYLQLASSCNVSAVVVLNKVDLITDLKDREAEVTDIVGNVPVIAVSASTGENMNNLAKLASDEGKTSVLLGSSGAGKSTITNWLLGESRQAVNETRLDDSRGRHTTTSRQLFALPQGGYLIDTPGMRELAMVGEVGTNESTVFDKINHYTQNCKFRNCDHDRSAGCAVLKAVDDGKISERELVNYRKIMKEQEFLNSKEIPALAKHRQQNDKRQSQKIEAIKRQRLLRGR